MLVRRGRILSAALLWMGCAAALADAADLLGAHLSRLDTVSSRFEQRLFDEQRNLLERASGIVLIDRPGRFRFEYQEPPQLIVGDGARVWIYDPELAQVTVRDMDAALASTPAVLLTSDDPIDDWFRIEKLDTQQGLDVFDLDPKTEDTAFTRIRLAFVDGDLRRMELLDQFGQTSVIGFDEVRHHPTIPPGAFEFTPPPGVDVIDGSD